jgi:pantetheine-phosphate adenylyltransferase
MRAIYPGSFDPATNGHLDIIIRASKIFDELVVAVAENPSKNGMFGIEERMLMIREAAEKIPNLRVAAFGGGLLVDFAKEQNIKIIIRGLRRVADFEYELQMAQLNKTLQSGTETLFLPTDVKFSHLSSSFVKEIAVLGGDISSMVPPLVAKKIFEKINKL